MPDAEAVKRDRKSYNSSGTNLKNGNANSGGISERRVNRNPSETFRQGIRAIRADIGEKLLPDGQSSLDAVKTNLGLVLAIAGIETANILNLAGNG